MHIPNVKCMKKAFDAIKRPPNKCGDFFFLKSLDDPKNQTLVKRRSRFQYCLFTKNTKLNSCDVVST